jgi:hypothetical protein
MRRISSAPSLVVQTNHVSPDGRASIVLMLTPPDLHFCVTSSIDNFTFIALLIVSLLGFSLLGYDRARGWRGESDPASGLQ